MRPTGAILNQINPPFAHKKHTTSHPFVGGLLQTGYDYLKYFTAASNIRMSYSPGTLR